jgi:hypothetical protein
VLLHPVGVGAFGTVYKARDPELDRTVAIKVPRAGNVGRFLSIDYCSSPVRTEEGFEAPEFVFVPMQ